MAVARERASEGRVVTFGIEVLHASALAVVISGLWPAGPALAQSASGAQGLLDDPFVINGGVFVIGTDLRARLNGQTRSNPEIDFDETFGNASENRRGRLDMLWRISPNHHLRFLYFNDTSTRSRRLTKNIEWGDYTFLAGYDGESRVDGKVYELAYEYAIRRTPSSELNLSFGLHYMDLSTRVSGTATVVGGNGSAAISATRTADLRAPLPVVGFRGGWVIAPDWYIDAQAQLFKANVNAVSGYWTDLRVGATWMFSRIVGVGMGYNAFSSDVDVDKPNYNGSARFGYSGLQVYLTGTF